MRDAESHELAPVAVDNQGIGGCRMSARVCVDVPDFIRHPVVAGPGQVAPQPKHTRADARGRLTLAAEVKDIQRTAAYLTDTQRRRSQGQRPSVARSSLPRRGGKRAGASMWFVGGPTPIYSPYPCPPASLASLSATSAFRPRASSTGRTR